MTDVAQSFGMRSLEITDDPWLIMHHVRSLSKTLPAFLNVHIVRHLWHNGTGTDGPPEWDRWEMIKQEISKLGWGEEMNRIEKETEAHVDGLWEKHLKS